MCLSLCVVVVFSILEQLKNEPSFACIKVLDQAMVFMVR